MSTRGAHARRLLSSLSIGLLVLGLTAVPATGRVARQTAVRLPAPVPATTRSATAGSPRSRPAGSTSSRERPIPRAAASYESTGFINIGVTGTSFATGRTVAPTVFDIDILQDGKCYSPQDYSVLNYAAVQAIHVRGAKVIGYIDAGTAETWRPDFPEMQAFDQSCDGCLFGNPLSHFPDEYWLNINHRREGDEPEHRPLQTTRRFLLDEMLDAAEGSQADRRGRDRVRRRRRLSERQRARDHRGRPAQLQRCVWRTSRTGWASASG